MNVIKVIFFILSIVNKQNLFADSRSPNTNNKENQQAAAKMLLPWILITWIVLVFNLGVGILFGLDIQYPFKVDILIYLKVYRNQIFWNGLCDPIRNFKHLFRQHKMINVVSMRNLNLPIISFLPWYCLFTSVLE